MLCTGLRQPVYEYAVQGNLKEHLIRIREDNVYEEVPDSPIEYEETPATSSLCKDRLLLTIALDVARGLAYLHSRKVTIHWEKKKTKLQP